ncbi:MAG: SDR family NAD(P)-dependent oxidoreductase [Myxococcales bacterium]|nr:SDR family NAD(P)-dependent oxidoreductase [Myxococcales bacterium]
MTHVVVTGASAGIGEGMVREWVRAGASVTMVARRRELMQSLADEVGGTTRVVAADLGDPGQATRWLADAEAELGPVDVLVNNAGVQIVAASSSVSLERARALLEVDLLAPLALAHAVLPAMLRRGAGAIVNIASVAALGPTPGMLHYNAAKAGLAAASESLRGELRRTGVHVVTVYPGPVDTPMSRAAYEVVPPSPAVRLLPIGNTATLARRVRRAVERRRARVIYPWLYTLSRHFPALTRWMLDRFTPPLPAPEDPSAR